MQKLWRLEFHKIAHYHTKTKELLKCFTVNEYEKHKRNQAEMSTIYESFYKPQH